MKPVNILALLQAKANLSNDLFGAYRSFYGINIKDAEYDDLANLASTLIEAGSKVSNLSSFYVGYQIPQIGKEFDLLRFGQSAIINIELKSQSSPEKVLKQHLRNQYYLKFTARQVYSFTFISSSGHLYSVSNSSKLEDTSINQLVETIAEHKVDIELDPNSLFNPSDYLVSPLNSTSNFLAREYFLTNQQEEIKRNILNLTCLESQPSFTAIAGAAGTGKTLLTYDIARALSDAGKTTLIIHCGILNQGHHALRMEGWSICSIKDIAETELNVFDVIIVDEAQRIKGPQLDELISQIESGRIACIFSYDRTQTLSHIEATNNSADKIEAISNLNTFKLTTRIRTNNGMMKFIDSLFDKNINGIPQSNNDIQISFFDNTRHARLYLDGLRETGWEVLRLTPSRYNKEHHESYYPYWCQGSHQVIGQEFDNVAMAIDRFFTYDGNGQLDYRGKAYYAASKMLYQNATRARKRLCVVIIQNEEILRRCLAILG
jgi:hypothetical protein